MDVEEFLAAPKQVTESESERKKHAVRKALLEAEQLRKERLFEGCEPPTIEEILADLVRVASDPDTNPLGHKTLSTGEKRHQKFGHIPMRFIHEEFGTFGYALQVAGLRHEAGTKLKHKAREVQARKEHTARYKEAYVAPYVLDSERYKETRESIRDMTCTNYVILSISDLHATFTDPWTLLCFMKMAKHVEPDCLYLNGDIFEGAAISRHPKIPGWTLPLHIEAAFIQDLFRLLRSHFPDTTIIWGAGNHGVDRIASYLAHSASALAGLPSMRIDKLVDLDGLDIVLAQQGTIASPENQEDVMEQGTVFFGQYRVTHGTKLGQAPSMGELKYYLMSGQSGHVHRGSVSHMSSPQHPDMSWMSTPMACTPRAGRAYMKGAAPFGWQQGMGLATLSPVNSRVQQQCIITSGGVMMAQGLTLEMPANFPEEPPANRNWLKEWNFNV